MFPTSAAWLIFGIAAAVYGLNMIVCMIAFYHGDFPPLRAKNVLFVTLNAFAHLLFFAGISMISGVYASILPLSADTCFAGQTNMLLLGTSIISCVLIMRLTTLLQTMRWMRHPSLIQRLMPGVVSWLPWVALFSAAFWIPETMNFNQINASCMFASWFTIVVSILVNIQWISLLVLAGLVFSVGRTVREYKECLLGIIVYSLASISAILAMALVSTASLSIVAVLILLVLNLLAGQVYFYFVMGHVLYGTLFHRDHTLKEFILDLQNEGADYQSKMQQKQSRASGSNLQVDNSYRQMMRKQSGVGTMGLGMQIGTPELNY